MKTYTGMNQGGTKNTNISLTLLTLNPMVKVTPILTELGQVTAECF